MSEPSMPTGRSGSLNVKVVAFSLSRSSEGLNIQTAKCCPLRLTVLEPVAPVSQLNIERWDSR